MCAYGSNRTTFLLVFLEQTQDDQCNEGQLVAFRKSEELPYWEVF